MSVKKYVIYAAVLIAGAGLILSGAKIPRIFAPDPRIIMAEDNSMNAVQDVLEMRYSSAATSFEEIIPLIPHNLVNKRWYARALMHLGRWEEAAENLSAASADSSLNIDIDADAERLRFLERGRVLLPIDRGTWERLKVNFAFGEGIGAVSTLDAGMIATAVPDKGMLVIWSPTGNRVAEIRGVGTPVAMSFREGKLWVADMSGDRLFLISREWRIAATIELAELGVHGVRDVKAADDGTIWIADFGGRRALRLRDDGTLISEAGRGEIEGPTAVLPIEGDLLVAESAKNRVVRFDRNGRLLKEYSDPRLLQPKALERISGGFLIQADNGMVFVSRDDDNNILNMLRLQDGPMVTSNRGLSADADENIWWGDGNSLRTVRRIPFPNPLCSVEIVRVKQNRGATSSGYLEMTVAVMDRSGKPLGNLDKASFRIIHRGQQSIPIRVENLSNVIAGRRFAVVIEASDALLPHKESLERMIAPFIDGLTSEDRTCVIDAGDSFRFARDFTASPQLIRNALINDRQRVAAIDVRPNSALKTAIETLAPTDYGRAILLITSGAGMSGEGMTFIRRMALINQTPIFVIHAGAENESELVELARISNGGYVKLYRANPSEFTVMLSKITSGRYRITTPMALTERTDRGRWFEVACEVKYYSETVFDKSGYYAF